MPHIYPEMLRSPKRACQTLALLRTKLVIEALLVQRAVAVITSVRVPTPITARMKTKNSPFGERRTHNVSQRSEPSRTGGGVKRESEIGQTKAPAGRSGL
jgi:hypothetical protein